MAKNFNFSSSSARAITFADLKSRPMTEWGSDTPVVDAEGRPLHAITGMTLLIDGGQIPEARIEAPGEMSFPAGSIVSPAGGAASVTLGARSTGEKSAALVGSARAPRWEVIGQADVAALLAGSAGPSEKAGSTGKGGDQR